MTREVKTYYAASADRSVIYCLMTGPKKDTYILESDTAQANGRTILKHKDFLMLKVQMVNQSIDKEEYQILLRKFKSKRNGYVQKA